MDTPSLAHIISQFHPRFHIDPCLKLPPELISLIFSHFDPITLLTCGLVSKLWRKKSFDSLAWRRLYFAEGWRFNFNAVKLLEQELAAQARREQEQERRRRRRQEQEQEQEQDQSQHQLSNSTAAETWRNQNDQIEADNDDRHTATDDMIIDDDDNHHHHHNLNHNHINNPNYNHDNYNDNDNDNPLYPDVRYAGSTCSSEYDYLLSPMPDTPDNDPAFPSFYDRLTRSDSLSSIPSYYFNKRTNKLELNWYKLYRLRHELEQSWLLGRCIGFTLPSPKYREEGHKDFVYSLQHSGKWLVSGSRDMTIGVWDLERKRLRGGDFLRGHEQSVLCLQFDPDPSQDVIISGGSDRKIIIWKFSTGEVIKRIDDAHSDSVLNLGFDSRYLLTCSKDKTIKVWNRTLLSSNDHHLLPHPTPTPSPTTSITVSPALSDLLAGKIPHIHPYTPLLTLHGHTAAINAIQLHNDECTSASGDRTIRVWNIRTGQCLRTFTDHAKGIACVQTDGNTIISGSNDWTVRVFNRKKGKQVASFTGHHGLVRTVQGYIPEVERPAAAAAAVAGNKRRATNGDGNNSNNNNINNDGDADVVASEADDDHDGSDSDTNDVMDDYYMDLAADVDGFARERNPFANRNHRSFFSSSSSSSTTFASSPATASPSKYARIVSGSYDGSFRIWTRYRRNRWRVSHSFTVGNVLRCGRGQPVRQDTLHGLETERIFKVQFDASRLIVGSQHPVIVGLDFGLRKKRDWEVYRFFEL